MNRWFIYYCKLAGLWVNSSLANGLTNKGINYLAFNHEDLTTSAQKFDHEAIWQLTIAYQP